MTGPIASSDTFQATAYPSNDRSFYLTQTDQVDQLAACYLAVESAGVAAGAFATLYVPLLAIKITALALFTFSLFSILGTTVCAIFNYNDVEGFKKKLKLAIIFTNVIGFLGLYLSTANL